MKNVKISRLVQTRKDVAVLCKSCERQNSKFAQDGSVRNGTSKIVFFSAAGFAKLNLKRENKLKEYHKVYYDKHASQETSCVLLLLLLNSSFWTVTPAFPVEPSDFAKTPNVKIAQNFAGE